MFATTQPRRRLGGSHRDPATDRQMDMIIALCGGPGSPATKIASRIVGRPLGCLADLRRGEAGRVIAHLRGDR